MRDFIKSIMFVFLVCFVVLPTAAKDFGIRGNNHSISEQPFLEMMHERLQKVDMEKERKKMEQIARMRIHNPLPITNVTSATENKTFYYDPTYILDEDAILPDGTMLHPAGTSVNPLEYIEFDRKLIFIDEREQNQVNWLKNKLEEDVESELENKIILVGGSPLKLQEELGVNIYFDQQGALTTTFGITHTPAILIQEGLRLKVKEFKLSNL